MPKIDWFESADDLPHWEPRPRRERLARDARDRRARLQQIIAVAAAASPASGPPARRPLHLIWGEPKRSPDRT